MRMKKAEKKLLLFPSHFSLCLCGEKKTRNLSLFDEHGVAIRQKPEAAL